MAIVLDTPPQARFGDVQARLIDYAKRVEQLRSPDEVLDELNTITTQSLSLSVLGAARLPSKSGDWESIQVGKSAFLHKDVPEGWWEDFNALAPDRFRPIAFLAMTNMAPYTWTEVRRMLEPIGVERLKYDLELKYGMRDGLSCPVGGRWMVVFWSRKVLSSILTQPLRVVIFAAASFAALRLEQLAGPDPKRIGSRSSLTPRETSVLRLASTGAQSHGIAQALGLGEETVRSHLKKAQTKLGARTRAHAVAEALRQRLIP
jgi:DNA-binding CsgD family transcriptional regulator